MKYYVVRFTRVDQQPPEEYQYASCADADYHFNLFTKDDSGLYTKIELLAVDGHNEEVLKTINFVNGKAADKHELPRLTRRGENSTIQQMRVQLVTMLGNLDDDTLVDVAGCAGMAEGDQSIVAVNMDNYLDDMYENTCDGLRDFAQKVQGFNAGDDYLIRDNGDVTTFADLHALAEYLRQQTMKIAALVMDNWGDDKVLRDALPDDMIALLSGNN